VIDPDRLAELEEERDHLLASIEDLEVERDAGDIDTLDFETLRDAYTARAAEVIRSIEQGRADLRRRPVRDWPRTIAVWTAIIVVALGLGVFVARSAGQRLPGQELTGGLPGDISATLVEARQLLGIDPARSQALYTEVLAQRPQHPEALAYTGWLLAINSLDADQQLRTLALETARRALDDSIASDPTYADPYCFRAIIAANFDAGASSAEVDRWLEGCLDRSPPAELRALVSALVIGPGPDD
jgi:hypothetical protein